MMKSVCVFCGASLGKNPSFQIAAQKVGQEIGRRKMTLVYGGGNTGLMGVVANATMKHGGYVIGIIPHGLVLREAMHTALSEEHVVNTMHERKALMSEKCDAYIAMPGGFGTYEELYEVITWAQLGIHQKPIIVFNVDGYFSPFIEMTRHTIEQGFIRSEGEQLYSVANSVAEIFDLLDNFKPENRPQWLTKDQI